MCTKQSVSICLIATKSPQFFQDFPDIFGLETAYSVMDGFIRKLYPDDFKAKKREAWDIMLDHRLNPDDISRTSPPEIEDLVYARRRGMTGSTFST